MGPGSCNVKIKSLNSQIICKVIHQKLLYKESWRNRAQTLAQKATQIAFITGTVSSEPFNVYSEAHDL